MRATMIQLGILHRNCEAKLNHIFKHLMQFFRNDLKFKRSMRIPRGKHSFLGSVNFTYFITEPIILKCSLKILFCKFG